MLHQSSSPNLVFVLAFYDKITLRDASELNYADNIMKA